MARRLGLGLREVEAMEHVMLSEVWPGEQRIGAADLARLLGITTAASTQLLHRLEANHHLDREPHPTDRRRVVLRATDAGRGHVMRQLGPLLAALGAVAYDLTPEDAVVVERYLRDVEAVFRRFSQEKSTEA
jgi:DNA-binding MarR family transcriptional regulator